MNRSQEPMGLLASAVRVGARGVVAAMAMSGLRQATASLGLVKQTPPEQLLKRAAPGVFDRVPVNRRPALVELIHWGYGGAAGIAFGLLPGTVRRRRWVGLAYGFAIWALFESVAAPVLGIDVRRQASSEKLALLVDHALYGVVVSG